MATQGRSKSLRDHECKSDSNSTQETTARAAAEVDSPSTSVEKLNVTLTQTGSIKDNKDNEDPNIVSWDGPDDPANPMNWPSWMKFVNVAIISGLTFVTPLASSMFAPGVPDIMVEFQSSNTLLASFVVSVYVLGFAIGPLVLAPMSELYGRLIVYHICNVGFVIFTVACAVSTDLSMFIIFRFFQGCVGAAPVTNGRSTLLLRRCQETTKLTTFDSTGGGTIADLVRQEKRGGALAIYALGPLLGPVIGPVAGGYLTAAKGWRWVFWVLTIIEGFFIIMSVLFLRETYASVLLGRKAARLRKATGNPALRSKMDSGLSARQLFIRSIVRPSKILIFSPIALACSVYTGVVYGYLYLMFATFTFVFQEQ
jgi:MFS family permease